MRALRFTPRKLAVLIPISDEPFSDATPQHIADIADCLADAIEKPRAERVSMRDARVQVPVTDERAADLTWGDA